MGEQGPHVLEGDVVVETFMLLPMPGRVLLTGAGNCSGTIIWGLVVQGSGEALGGLGPRVQKSSRVQPPGPGDEP